jgi:hypothetical protein
MIKFVNDKTEYTFRNEGDEVTLSELGKINDIMQDEKLMFFEKWLKVVALLGSKELAEQISEENLVNLIEHFNVTALDKEIKETLEVNGRTYSCVIVDGEIKFSGRQLAAIESNIKKNKEWAGHVFAVIYKDNQLGDKEHYEQAHIDYKASLFLKHVTADIAAPVIFQVNKRLIENFDRMAKLNAKR